MESMQNNTVDCTAALPLGCLSSAVTVAITVLSLKGGHDSLANMSATEVREKIKQRQLAPDRGLVHAHAARAAHAQAALVPDALVPQSWLCTNHEVS